MSSKVTCSCGWSWNKSDSSKKDLYVCHQCGKDNTMKDGGWLSKYNDVPEAQNGIEGTMGGLTDKGFDYNVKNRFIIFSTTEILKRMLHEEIREKQNLVYSISVQNYGVSKFPEPKYSVIIMFDSDPNNKDKISIIFFIQKQLTRVFIH